MPTYDFRCPECGKEFSKLLPAGTKETECIVCGKFAQKLLSAPAVHFKGEGFYKSDSAKEGGK